MTSPRPTRRPERPEDDAFRLALFVEARRDDFAALEPDLRIDILRRQFAAQTSAYRAAFPEARFDIVECGGAAVGRIVTDRSADTLVLVDLAIAAAHRGRGIATSLLLDLLREAAAADLPVRLRVALGNVSAQRLYARLGFALVATSALDLSMECHPVLPAGEVRGRA